MNQFLWVTETLFWVLLILLVHCYFIFPVTLPFLSELFRRRDKKQEETFPKVSVLISAYNEEAVIETKIKNLLEIDYPKDRIEFLIGDDGSADKTAEIVSRYAGQGIRLVQAEKNAGKAAMLNRLETLATGEILLFCDANTLFFPNVVRRLTEPFSDPEIGCACGHLILSDSSGSDLGRGEASYWDFESEIKKFEGKQDRLIGGNGALYAVRKSLYTKLPVKKSVMDDFFITVKILQKGFFCTFVSNAIGTEQTSKDSSGEFRRKVRIGRANYNYLFSYLPLLNPFRPLVAYLFFSHKLLRWFTPHLFLLILLANLALLFTGKPVYFVTLGVFLMILFAAALKISKSVYYFLQMNIALLKGFVLSFKPEKGGGWAREARGDEASAGVKSLILFLAAFAGFSIFPQQSFAGFTADVTVGTLNPTKSLKDFNLDVSAHWWFPLDQMVFIGAGGGYQEVGDVYLVPVTASAILRLPIGGQVLPVATFDYGYAFGNHRGRVWKAGGGLDIKNGDHTSIFLMGGYQSQQRMDAFLYLRAGILIEY
ncbi:MAG: glycosyltransferase family 2 protein [Fibrobacter sp.]|nr:glycosyltransferase family 2 protein [Fibrobacter sp.]